MCLRARTIKMAARDLRSRANGLVHRKLLRTVERRLGRKVAKVVRRQLIATRELLYVFIYSRYIAHIGIYIQNEPARLYCITRHHRTIARSIDLTRKKFFMYEAHRHQESIKLEIYFCCAHICFVYACARVVLPLSHLQRLRSTR